MAARAAALPPGLRPVARVAIVACACAALNAERENVFARLSARARASLPDPGATKLASNVAELGRLGLVAADVVGDALRRDADAATRECSATSESHLDPRDADGARKTRTSVRRRVSRVRRWNVVVGAFGVASARVSAVGLGGDRRRRVGLGVGRRAGDQRRRDDSRDSGVSAVVRDRARDRVGVVARDARWRPRPRRPSRSPSSRRSRRCP